MVHYGSSKSGPGVYIEFFEDSYFGGESELLFMSEGTCYNLALYNMQMQNRVSSIRWLSSDPGNCIYLFDQNDCTGDKLEIDSMSFCIAHLSTCEPNFDKKTVSVMLCDYWK